MQEYGCNIEVSDYWADKIEVHEEYGIELIEDYNLDEYQAVIVAVGHNKYKDLEISNKNKVVFDIKSILKNADGRL